MINSNADDEQNDSETQQIEIAIGGEPRERASGRVLVEIEDENFGVIDFTELAPGEIEVALR